MAVSAGRCVIYPETPVTDPGTSRVRSRRSARRNPKM